MIVMNLKIDNICGFRNFNICFSYPKKIVGSRINETLNGYKHFRYKKINIISGTNASGKTTLGRVMMSGFNLMRRMNPNGLKSMIGSSDKDAVLVMDFIPDGHDLYRLSVVLEPGENNDRQSAIVKAAINHEKILKKDNYEQCAARLSEQEVNFSTDLAEVFKEVPYFGWYFSFPGDQSTAPGSIVKDSKLFPEILSDIMMTLDNSITNVEKVPSSDSDYLMEMAGQDTKILIHDGKIQDSDLGKVSSGTKAGVKIASFISAIKEDTNSFYYCDEMFSFVQTDIEKAVLSLLCVLIKDNDQLFFTTHNENVLDIGLPMHSFTFMKKDHYVTDCPIEAVVASEYIKKNNVSLRNAVENDLLSTLPSLEKIYQIEDIDS